MSQLFFLLLLILSVYLGLTTLTRLIPMLNINRSLRGRVSVAFLFMVTGITHFTDAEAMALMLPPAIPSRVEIIYITGVLEILGAIGIVFPGLVRLSSIALILFLVGVLPSNIYAAVNSVDFGGHVNGPVYLLARIPFQLFIIFWIYYFGIRIYVASGQVLWKPLEMIDLRIAQLLAPTASKN